jgi:hypothetical protein
MGAIGFKPATEAAKPSPKPTYTVVILYAPGSLYTRSKWHRVTDLRRVYFWLEDSGRPWVSFTAYQNRHFVCLVSNFKALQPLTFNEFFKPSNL